MFSAVPCRLPSSPAVLCRHLPSHTRRCLTSWGSSSFVMTAVLEVQGRERTAFCRPVRSFSKVARQVGMKDEDGPRPAVPSRPGLLAVPPPGPAGAPEGCEHWQGPCCFPNSFACAKALLLLVLVLGKKFPAIAFTDTMKIRRPCLKHHNLP